jgi:hypothetical protein
VVGRGRRAIDIQSEEDRGDLSILCHASPHAAARGSTRLEGSLEHPSSLV